LFVPVAPFNSHQDQPGNQVCYNNEPSYWRNSEEVADNAAATTKQIDVADNYSENPQGAENHKPGIPVSSENKVHIVTASFS
jgi:hypothetical protein